jgi:hypothetical protein
VARLPASSWFALLIAAQAVHSTEEYITRLYDRFAPAGAVSDALGLDRPVGFLVANLLLVGFGLWCWLARVRPRRALWRGLAWFWAVLESLNGVGHLLLAFAAGGYFPGVATAPLLLALGMALAARLRSEVTS